MESTLYPNYDSGILVGYWTPIYGFGVILILFIDLFLRKKFKISKYWYPVILFLSCGVILALIEMISGYLIEFIFHRVFWNYKYHQFNIGLYTSLEMAGIWGLSGLLVVYVIKPILNFIVSKIPSFITWILIVLFITDVLYKVSLLF